MVLNSNDQIQASTVAVCSKHFQQNGDMTRWDVQWWLARHHCFWIEIGLVVINPGSVTETGLPDMLVTAAVPDIRVTGRLGYASKTTQQKGSQIAALKLYVSGLCNKPSASMKYSYIPNEA